MLRLRSLAALPLLTLAVVAGHAQGQPPAKDAHGDPLPPGAVARLGTVRFRHEGNVVFAAFLAGGKSVLSVGNDGSICVWEFPSGKELHRFETHPAKERLAGPAARVKSASLSPDGKHLTVFCSDGFLRIWDVVNGKHLGAVANVVDGTGAGTATGPGMSSALEAALYGSPRAAAVMRGPVYSPDGKTLMLVGAARVLQFVDLAAAKEVGPALGHVLPLTAVHFTPDGRQLLTKDAKTTRTWEAATAKELGALTVKLPPNASSPLAVSDDGRVGLAEVYPPVPDVPLAANVRQAALFDTASGKVLAEMAFDADTYPFALSRAVLFSPDGKLLAVCLGSDQNARERVALYEVPTGKLVRTLDAGPAPAQGKVKGGFGGGGKGGKGLPRALNAQRLLFSPDGQALAFQLGSGAAIVVLDTATGTRIGGVGVGEGATPFLQGVFSPDGRCLALQLGDGTVTLYELATGQARRTYGPKVSPAVAVDPLDDFQMFISARAAALLKTSVGIALSPDGNLLALAAPDGIVPVLDVLTGKELTLFKGHTGAVKALAFAPGGKALATASTDTTVLLWDVGKLKRPAGSATAPAVADLDAWWQALAGDDAVKAFAAVGDFVAAPKQAVAYLQGQVKPAAPLDPKRIAELLAQLDSKQYKAREQATRELLKLGDQLVPVLDKALAANPPAEIRQRLEQLHGKLTGPRLQGERLRVYRAVEVLERIGTPEARQLLQALADGEPGALVTACARAALKR
jgi:WD40 repeat protein